jgi:uncharacterized membrane protein YhaH (DUF805 family)
LDFVTLFSSLNGRVGRKQFWIGAGILLALNILLRSITIAGLPRLALGLLGYISLGAAVCLHGKRLHDTGRSAWWAAIPTASGLAVTAFWIYVGTQAAASGALVRPTSMALIASIPDVAWVIWTIWLGTRKSQPHDNKYGPGPQGASVAAVFE